MKDKSKRLTVVNTGKKPSEKKEVQQIVVQPSSSSSSHAPGFNSNLYLLKSVWDSVFEIKTDGSGQKYIFGKLPVVTKYGITMYADDGSLNLPSIYEGLPIDGVTLYWDNGVLKAKGGEGGGGGVADSIAWANVYGKPSWVTDTKPIYNYSEIKNTPDLSVFVTDTALSNTLADYATLTYLTGELKKYVTLDGEQDITGIKDFINGLKIGGIELIKKQDDVVYLDGNLVVKGGITMYGDGEGGSSAPLYSTLGSLENVDKDAIDAVASVDRVLFQSAGSNVWSWKALSEIGGGSSGGGSVSGAVRYLSTLGSTGSWYDSTYRLYVEWGLHDRLYLKTEGGYDVVANLAEKDGNGNVIASTYLPLSGGTLKGTLNTQFIRPSVNAAYQCGTSSLRWDNIYSVYGNFSNSITINGSTAVHAGNISSYNAGSATKLQTARTIWGQSFDGTGNVDGVLTVKQTTQYASIKINSIHSTTQSFITFQANGVDKGNVGWTNGNGTHLYNATSLKTLELTNDGKLTYGESTAGDEVWHAGNSNLSTVDWNVNSLVAFCGGTSRQIVISKKSYTWGGESSTHPLIASTTSADSLAYTMIAMPHVPFLKKGARGYNGDDFGAIIRFEGDASSTRKVWDVGCVSTSANNFFVQCDGKNIASFGNSGLTAIYTPNQWLSNSMLVLGRTDTSTMTTSYAQIGVTDGNLHIDAYKGKEIYLNYYQGSGTSTRILANGSILTSGGITMYSDQRKKTILNHVELSLKQIADAPLIEHYYNSDQDKTTHVGSIAQYWAGMNDWFCKLDSEGFYTMEIQNCALASAISIARHLEKYESKTDKKIRMLKKRVQELEDKLEKLEGGNYGCN